VIVNPETVFSVAGGFAPRRLFIERRPASHAHRWTHPARFFIIIVDRPLIGHRRRVETMTTPELWRTVTAGTDRSAVRRCRRFSSLRAHLNRLSVYTG